MVNADVIKLHYGEPIKGKATEIAEEYIKYIPDDESLVRTIGYLSVNRIEFTNGKVEEISPLIVINDPKKDWENVVVVYDKNAVKGMAKLVKALKKPILHGLQILKKKVLNARYSRNSKRNVQNKEVKSY